MTCLAFCVINYTYLFGCLCCWRLFEWKLICVCGCLCPGNFCGIAALFQIIFFISVFSVFVASLISLIVGLSLWICLCSFLWNVYVHVMFLILSFFYLYNCVFPCIWRCDCLCSGFCLLLFMSPYVCVSLCMCGALLLWPRRVPLLCVTDRCCCCLHQDDILDLQLQRNLDYLDQQVRLTQHS